MSIPLQVPSRALIVACLIALVGCTPRIFQRSTVVFDQANLDDYTIKYGELDGCLLKQQVPQSYGVARPRYALALRVGSATAGAAPRIEVIVKGSGEVSARFPDLSEQPDSSIGGEGSRYSIDTAALKGGRMTVEILRGDEILGSEFFKFKQRSCSGISLLE